MTGPATWLKEIIVLNENADALRPGDVQIFRSALGLCHHLEPWYVNEVGHLALGGIGDRVVLGVAGNNVVIERIETYEGGLDLLRSWLEPTALHVHNMRVKAEKKKRLARGSRVPDWVMPEGIEALIGYVGFEK
ncbi:MAG: hypothetical protein H7124_00110 [Phycisphaerales bacterium]|nr:hypothetical protein [Hyphomonadaceae bacterium]